MKSLRFLVPAIAGMLALTSVSSAAVVPFEEAFTSDSAGWLNNTFAPLNWVSTGGSDSGGYGQTTFNFVNTPETGPMDQGPVIFRGGPGASGSAFVGNWIADGVTNFSTYIRHDAAESLLVFARFASPVNFPGAVGVDIFTSVAPNTWTQINIPIVDAFPPFVTFEGSDFNTVFSNIGNLQIGVNAPAGVAGVDFGVTLELDQVRIVPEPGSMLLGLLASMAFFSRRHRARRA
jgi:hypothetical protein